MTDCRAEQRRAEDYRAVLRRLESWLVDVVAIEFPNSVAVAMEIRAIRAVLAKHGDADD